MAKTEYVMVECISQYRMRYVVEVPEGKTDWALDTVTMEQAKEFSQRWLGETIFSHRKIKKDDIIKEFDRDNDYLSQWSEEDKLEYVTTIKDYKNLG